MPTPRRFFHPVLASVFAGLLFAGCDDVGTPDVGTSEVRPTKSNIGTTGGSTGKGVAAAKGPETIRLGTWNLEHFGQRDLFQSREGDPPNRTEEQIAAIAEFIRDMTVDVLAVQEIGGPASMRKLMNHLGDDYRFTLGTTGGYDKTMISVGFVWNRKKVELEQSEEMLDFPREVGELAVFHRKPVNAVFRVLVGSGSGSGSGSGFDFRAITVHLKASKGQKNEAKRQAEAKILREYLAKLQAADAEDRDIVVLGDFNHTFDAPAHRVFGAEGLVEYVANPNPTSMGSPTIIWFDEPIDHVALTDGIREELIPGSRKVHSHLVDFRSSSQEALAKQKAAWRATYSDHFPVTIDLDASRDRDPKASFTAPVHKLEVGTAK